MRTIGVITTSRAEYGVYAPLLQRIQAHRQMRLWVYASGMHLSKEYGNTIKTIEEDGYTIKAKVKMTLSDQPLNIALAMGQVTQGFAKAFFKDRPDLLLVLGDRYEMLAAALAAIPFGIPLAHIHGGEVTYGSFDDYFRHCLTQLSQLHFVSTEEYAKRVKQMGQDPQKVFCVGALGVEATQNEVLLPKEYLSKTFKIDFRQPIILVTFHPVTMELDDTKQHIRHLLSVLAKYKNYHIVFTKPNSDPGHQIIDQAIVQFVKEHRNAIYVAAFGHKAYSSMMRYAKVMVGNSSSGILEAATVGLPVVNIGSRQDGRVRGRNVIDSGYTQKDIQEKLIKALSVAFRQSLKNLKNPYGQGNTSQKILHIIEQVNLKTLRVKRFFDLKLRK